MAVFKIPFFIFSTPLFSIAKYFLLTRSLLPRLNIYKTPYNILKRYGSLEQLFCANWTNGSQPISVSSSRTQTVPMPSQYGASSVMEDEDYFKINAPKTIFRCFVSPPITKGIQLEQVYIITL